MQVLLCINAINAMEIEKDGKKKEGRTLDVRRVWKRKVYVKKHLLYLFNNIAGKCDDFVCIHWKKYEEFLKNL